MGDGKLVVPVLGLFLYRSVSCSTYVSFCLSLYFYNIRAVDKTYYESHFLKAFLFFAECIVLVWVMLNLFKDTELF